MKIESDTESDLYQLKYIKGVVSGLLIPQHFARPHYLSDDSQVILMQSYNEDKRDNYRIETEIVFLDEQLSNDAQKQIGSSHLIDTIQNLADVVSYFSSEIIKLDRCFIPKYIDENKNYFEKYAVFEKEINAQTLPNAIPLNQDVGFRINFNFDELNPNITLVNYDAQISFRIYDDASERGYEHTSLFLNGTGQAYPYLNRSKLNKLLRNNTPSLFKWK